MHALVNVGAKVTLLQALEPVLSYDYFVKVGGILCETPNTAHKPPPYTNSSFKSSKQSSHIRLDVVIEGSQRFQHVPRLLCIYEPAKSTLNTLDTCARLEIDTAAVMWLMGPRSRSFFSASNE